MFTINSTHQDRPNFSACNFQKRVVFLYKTTQQKNIKISNNKKFRQELFKKIKTSLKNYFLSYPKQISYTVRHKKAFLDVEKELTGKNTFDGYLHDTDKLIMYIIGISDKLANKIHQTIAAHHIKNGVAKKPIQTVIDWECARRTKSDKPLSAMEFYKKYYVEECNVRIPEIEETLKYLGLWDELS